MYTHQAELKLNKNGFTLIETLIALAILTMAIIPAFVLSNSTINSSSVIRDDMIASGLAQEGIEVVRAIRDTNWFNGRAFNYGLGDGQYRVEWDSTSLLTLAGNPFLKLDNGLYNYSTGNDTVFKRTVTITNVSTAEIKVVSQVTWQTRTNDSKAVTAEDHLFDWK